MNKTHQLTESHANALIKIFDLYSEQLRESVHHLENERQFIAARNFEALQTVLTQKEANLADIKQAEQQLYKLLGKYRIQETNIKEFNQLLANYNGPRRQHLEQIWTETRSLLTQCSRLNQINGTIIAHSRSSLARLLSILKGIDVNPKTYQKDGHAQNNSNSRSLAKI